MRFHIILTRVAPCLLTALLLCILLPGHGGSAGPGSGAAGSTATANPVFPSFDLPMPSSEHEKAYLGLTGAGDFRIGRIKPGIVIIEVFNFYCPFCHQAAPAVEQVYKLIQARPDLKDRVTMIGIGLGNSVYEARSFKEKYRVPFPVFSDRNMEISRMLGVAGTPTFIAVKVDGKGGEERFYFEARVFDDPSRFLSRVLKASGTANQERKGSR